MNRDKPKPSVDSHKVMWVSYSVSYRPRACFVDSGDRCLSYSWATNFLAETVYIGLTIKHEHIVLLKGYSSSEKNILKVIEIVIVINFIKFIIDFWRILTNFLFLQWN